MAELRCVCAEVPADGSSKGQINSPLLDDMKRIQRKDAFLDMVFVCGREQELQEVEVRASRTVVASRSPVLESMLLTSGMVETRSTRIPLPLIHPTVMRICLEFFHTDTVEQSSWPPDGSMAFHVLQAAMFFLVKPLQIVTLTHISNTFGWRSHSKDAQWWASHVTSYNLAVELISSHQEHYQCHINRFLCRFRGEGRRFIAGCSKVKLLSGLDRERCFYKDLSEPALFHFIQGSTRDEESMYGLSPYFCFLHVVRWTAYRVVLVGKPDSNIDEGKFEEALNKCFPRSMQVMRTMLSSTVHIPFNDADVSGYMKLLAGPLAKCLERAPLNFAEMPPNILCRFIEPLDVLPGSTILAAYRLHALRTPDLQWDELAHGKQYRLDKINHSVISCFASGWGLEGFARCSTYLSPQTCSFLDWEIVMLHSCAELRVGFCFCKPTFRVSDCESHALGDRKWSWALDADGFLYNGGKKSAAPYVDAFTVERNVVIQVHLDMVSKSCSFSINNKNAGVAWSNLQLEDNQGLYPAISFMTPGEAQVRTVHQGWIDRPSKRICLSTSEDTSTN